MIYRMTNSFEDAAIILADSGMLQSTAEKSIFYSIYGVGSGLKICSRLSWQAQQLFRIAGRHLRLSGSCSTLMAILI